MCLGLPHLWISRFLSQAEELRTLRRDVLYKTTAPSIKALLLRWLVLTDPHALTTHGHGTSWSRTSAHPKAGGSVPDIGIFIREISRTCNWHFSSLY